MVFRFEAALDTRLAGNDGSGVSPGFLVGEDLHLNDPDIYQRICLRGWSGMEPNGVWSEDRVAYLQIPVVDARGKACAIWLAGQPFVSATHSQLIEVACDGVPLGLVRFDEEVPHRRILKIVRPAHASDDGPIRITFTFRTPTSPRKEGLSADDRQLGFMVERLAVTLVDAPCPLLFEGPAILLSRAEAGTPEATAAVLERMELALRLVEAQCDALTTELATTRILATEARQSAGLAVVGIDQLIAQATAAGRMAMSNTVSLGSDIVACRTHHGYVLADAADPAPLLVLADSADLEPGVRRFFERFVQPGMRIVDAGANLGVHTLALARLTGETGSVDAFEPAPRTLDLLRRSIAMNGLDDHVRVHGVALGAAEGEAVLHLGERSGFHSLYPLADTHGSATVQVRRLDDVLAADAVIDLLKADVEGAEIDLIVGAQALVARSADPVIVAEYAPSHLARSGQTPESWFAAFASAGLDQVFAIDEPGGTCRAVDPASLPDAVSLNLVFARAGSQHIAAILGGAK